MKIEESATDKDRWKLVRTDDYRDIPGDVVMADEDTGEAAVSDKGEMRHLQFSPRGFRIVRRR